MRDTLRIGRFVEAGSWAHRLDPRSKLTAMFLYLAAVLFIDSWYGLAALSVVSFAGLLSTRIPLSKYLKTLKPLRFLIAFVFAVPLLFEQDGFLHGSVAAGRMIWFVSFTATLTFTTETPRLVLGMESMLRPMRRLGWNPDRWTFMLAVALRFIPSIMEEADIVLKAQASRGVDFRELPWKSKAKALVTLLIPIASGAFRRASELIDAYASRGYRPGMERTRYEVLAWGRADTWFLLGFAGAMAAVVWTNAWAG
ncbi:energy-coupling factor transporter transmembrane protein EcfT [Paenibacillus antri]|uniref:Energy-coupling factor transporter transmembrane protein EcfT n=1 Tax=Paenibacillus antri TaxID=2582848 RepID=A0A5R9GAZ4_9BACL|nr:energy-coupling factor transporter transmembrane component T [Paenibacillus antri]TLS48575.1 energy-coupling factor transporter transmembrane protein EcfT [Paenibacillus antri]